MAPDITDSVEPILAGPFVRPTESVKVPDGTVSEVLDWVDADPARARAALDAERAGRNRSTLIDALRKLT